MSFLYSGNSGMPEEPRPRLFECVCTAVIILAGAVLQTCFFPELGGSGTLNVSALLNGFPFFGAAPDFVLMTVAAFAFFAGGRVGGIAGILAGFLLDTLAGTPVPISPIAFFLAGYIVGETNLSLPEKSFRAYAVPAALMLPVRAALTLIQSLAFAGSSFSLLKVLAFSVLPEMFWTAAAGAALFPLMRRVCRR